MALDNTTLLCVPAELFNIPFEDMDNDFSNNSEIDVIKEESLQRETFYGEGLHKKYIDHVATHIAGGVVRSLLKRQMLSLPSAPYR